MNIIGTFRFAIPNPKFGSDTDGEAGEPELNPVDQQWLTELDIDTPGQFSVSHLPSNEPPSPAFFEERCADLNLNDARAFLIPGLSPGQQIPRPKTIDVPSSGEIHEVLEVRWVAAPSNRMAIVVRRITSTQAGEGW